MKRFFYSGIILCSVLISILTIGSSEPRPQPSAPRRPVSNLHPRLVAPLQSTQPQPLPRIEIDLSERILTLTQAGRQQQFLVGVGSPATPTPVGAFKVSEMQVDPIYQNPFTGKIYAPGEDSPIGNRWIAFEKTMINGAEVWYGIHGTNQPSSIGQALSTGCIRMKRDDLLQVYEAIAPGSEIIIRQ